MYCTQCGNALGEGAANCLGCGQPVRRFPPVAAIPNHLIGAVLVTLCCCMPFGIVALVFAAQVNSKLAAGDVAGAQASSNSARTWTLVAFLAGLLTFGGGALLTLIDR
jgi:Interferon-induced transmembrane protein